MIHEIPLFVKSAVILAFSKVLEVVCAQGERESEAAAPGDIFTSLPARGLIAVTKLPARLQNAPAKQHPLEHAITFPQQNVTNMAPTSLL